MVQFFFIFTVQYVKTSLNDGSRTVKHSRFKKPDDEFSIIIYDHFVSVGYL